MIALAATPAHHRCHTHAVCQRVHDRRVNRWVRLHPWQHSRRHLSADTRRMLARLRGCETRGIAYPANYRYQGAHDGAYQYTASTWDRTAAFLPRWLRRHASPAIVWLRKVDGRARVTYATPSEQDVRTAYFYPSHKDEWACRA